ncbi:unnamed protein product [Boreogadus saida]
MLAPRAGVWNVVVLALAHDLVMLPVNAQETRAVASDRQLQHSWPGFGFQTSINTSSYCCCIAVTGRSFAEWDFRAALENGILLCQLLSCISPGLVTKINKLQTHIAGLENLCVFLRGCEDLGLKGSQLFDPGDLQETLPRPTAK